MTEGKTTKATLKTIEVDEEPEKKIEPAEEEFEGTRPIEEKPKRTYTKRKKVKVSRKSEKAIDALFNKFLGEKDDYWKLKPEDLHYLSTTTDDMLEKYAPTVGKYSVEISFLGAVGMIIVPRVLIYWKTRGKDAWQKRKQNFFTRWKKGKREVTPGKPTIEERESDSNNRPK